MDSHIYKTVQLIYVYIYINEADINNKRLHAVNMSRKWSGRTNSCVNKAVSLNSLSAIRIDRINYENIKQDRNSKQDESNKADLCRVRRTNEKS